MFGDVLVLESGSGSMGVHYSSKDIEPHMS